MVLAYFPQGRGLSIITDTNNPPQGIQAKPSILIEENPLLALFPPIGDASFQFYKFYQVNKNQVQTAQTNATVLITDTLGPGIIQQASGFDIRAFDSAGIPINYETESVDTSISKFAVWADMAILNDLEFVQLAFGNPSATNGSSSSGLWNGYSAVYHLNQTTFGIQTTRDSSVNLEDGTPQSMDNTNQVAGQIDGSLEFDGTNEFIVMNNSPELEPGNGTWTVSAWIRPDSDARMYIVGKQDPVNPFPGWAFLFSNTGNDRKLFVAMRGTGRITVRGTMQISLGVFHHVVCTYDGSMNASGIRLFIDGVEDTVNIELNNLTSGVTNELEFNIGNVGGIIGGSATWGGIIDEVNIFDNVQTPDFIKIAFNSQNDNNAFWHKTPLLENGVDNFLVDPGGRVIVAGGQP